jgi:hypothetical protein
VQTQNNQDHTRVQTFARRLTWIWKHGLINFFLRLSHQRTFNLENPGTESNLKTSISDNEAFNQFCESATESDDTFRNFRRYKPLIRILDHVGIEHAQQYLQYVNDCGVSARDYLFVLREMDSVGSPRRFRFDGIGLISPTITRYLKVYFEIQKLFGSLDGLVIAEIGVGFGGQAYLVNRLASPKKYYLLDLPSTSALAVRFLNVLNSPENFEQVDGREPRAVSSDLVISNYAFSELTREIQEEYLDKVISRSNKGYMTWNLLSERVLDGLRLDEVLARIPGARCIDEVPETSPGNVIVLWDR